MVTSPINTKLLSFVVVIAIGMTGALVPETSLGAVVAASQETASCFDTEPTITGEGVISGTDGDDVILGSDSDDVIDGGGGNDLVCGGGGNDVLLGGTGDDRLSGGSGNDAIDGQDGNDELIGDDGDDLAFGSAGDDILSGGSGSDVLHGDAGVNQLDGGDDNDYVNGGGQLSTCIAFEGDVLAVCVEESSGQFVEGTVGAAETLSTLPIERNDGCLLVSELALTLSGGAVMYECVNDATPEPAESDDLTVDAIDNSDDDSTLGNDDSLDGDDSDNVEVDDVVSDEDNVVDDDLSVDDQEEDAPADPDV